MNVTKSLHTTYRRRRSHQRRISLGASGPWADTKKAWEDLEEGKYDWAHQAMEYWPDRVKEKCETNKSFAIAHGLS